MIKKETQDPPNTVCMSDEKLVGSIINKSLPQLFVICPANAKEAWSKYPGIETIEFNEIDTPISAQTSTQTNIDEEAKIAMVMEQTNGPRNAAILALEETNGDVILAIIRASSYY